MVISANMNIVITYSLAFLVAIHSFKFRGVYKTLLLFFGAVIAGGGLENGASLFGGYYYPGDTLTIFLSHCPLDVVMGWVVLIYCSSYMAHVLVGKGRGSLLTMGFGTAPEHGIDKQFIKLTVLRAALAGAIAVNLDLLIDPVAVANSWWVWQVNNVYIQGVPLANYIGWWFMIFTFVVFSELAITYAETKQLKNTTESSLFAFFVLLGAGITAIVMLGINIVLAMDGIRNVNKDMIDLSLTAARVQGVIFTGIIVLVAIGLILASSLAPNKSEPPNGKIWRMLPPIIMLIFWAMIMLVAALTSVEMILIGLLQPLPFLALCVYLLVKPYDG